MSSKFWSETVKGNREIGWEDVDWMHLVQDKDRRQAVVNTVMNLQVPYKAETFLTS